MVRKYIVFKSAHKDTSVRMRLCLCTHTCVYEGERDLVPLQVQRAH